ncbi:hypothetical protein [Echinococcus multilocularis]|uniref:Uncharacterized protein n=1 Tax=Echinococcus multilocularis TaxID=6211 RepID=A0A0S4MJF3_ECHMU|nr:hypothetical protein [Echinococcus multilocularis]
MREYLSQTQWLDTVLFHTLLPTPDMAEQPALKTAILHYIREIERRDRLNANPHQSSRVIKFLVFRSRRTDRPFLAHLFDTILSLTDENGSHLLKPEGKSDSFRKVTGNISSYPILIHIYIFYDYYKRQFCLLFDSLFGAYDYVLSVTFESDKYKYLSEMDNIASMTASVTTYREPLMLVLATSMEATATPEAAEENGQYDRLSRPGRRIDTSLTPNRLLAALNLSQWRIYQQEGKFINVLRALQWAIADITGANAVWEKRCFKAQSDTPSTSHGTQ